MCLILVVEGCYVGDRVEGFHQISVVWCCCVELLLDEGI